MTRALIGRRAFLALSASSLLRAQSGKGSSSTFPPKQFLDGATEFDLFRLTDPRSNAWLPAPHLRFISRKGRFLLYVSDRSGTLQLHRLDWHTGESRQLTAAFALDRSSPTLSTDERSVYYWDGADLKSLALGNLRDRAVAQPSEGWERCPGFSLSADGATAIWVERQGKRSRVRSVRTLRGEPATVLEVDGLVTNPVVRPKGAQLSYRLNGGLRLVNMDGKADYSLPTEAGRTVGEALWSPDGATLLYLSEPDQAGGLVTLREYNPEARTDALVSKTSQFGSFGANRDTSVFVGASRSLASPYILLLLRSVRRELTLCEHRSTDPASVQPTFSSDSQNIFFTSDRTGKRCIYRAHVEKFVEETDDESSESR